jgi:hypothetical protein
MSCHVMSSRSIASPWPSYLSVKVVCLQGGFYANPLRSSELEQKKHVLDDSVFSIGGTYCDSIQKDGGPCVAPQPLVVVGGSDSTTIAPMPAGLEARIQALEHEKAGFLAFLFALCYVLWETVFSRRAMSSALLLDMCVGVSCFIHPDCSPRCTFCCLRSRWCT